MKSFILSLSFVLLCSTFSHAQWTKQAFVDEFGDPTGKYYITSDISYGHYTNTTATNADLSGYLVITENGIQINLFQYGSEANPAELFAKPIYRIENPANEVYTAFADCQTNKIMADRPLARITSWLKEFGSLKVSVEERGEEAGNYEFVITGSGFTKASYGMMFPEFVETGSTEPDNAIKAVNPIVYTDMMCFYKLSEEGKEKFASFKSANPTVIIDSVGVYYIVTDKDLENNQKIWVKKKDLRNNNRDHFKSLLDMD